MSLYVRLILIRLGLVFSAVLLALVGLAWMGRMIQYMDVLRDAAIPLSIFFSWVVLILPYVVYMILPLVAVITTFLVYNHFYHQHVLTILGGVGLSVGGRMRPAWYFGLACFLVSLGISFYALPVSYHLFKLKQHDLRQQQALNLIQPGRFFSYTDKTFYIETVAQDGGLQNVFVWSEDGGHASFVYAAAGRLVQGGEETFLLLKQGYQSILDDKKTMSRLDFDQYQIRFDHQPVEDYQRRSLLEFTPLTLITSDATLGQEGAKRWSAGHVRLLYPVLTLLFALYPALVFSKLPFSRTSGVMRPFLRVAPVALVVFSGFVLMGQAAESFPVMVYGLYAFLGAGMLVLLAPSFCCRFLRMT